MKKTFKELKVKMYREDVDQKTMCKIIGRSPTYLTRRMSAIEPFSAEDMLAFKRKLGINSPAEFVSLFFPGEDWSA